MLIGRNFLMTSLVTHCCQPTRGDSENRLSKNEENFDFKRKIFFQIEIRKNEKLSLENRKSDASGLSVGDRSWTG